MALYILLLLLLNLLLLLLLLYVFIDGVALRIILAHLVPDIGNKKTFYISLELS